MMTSRAALTLLGSIAAMAMATPAQAALVHFTFSAGTVTAMFTIDSATAPTAYSLGSYADYHGVEINFNNFPSRLYEVSFFTAADHGGIGIAEPGGSQRSIFSGAQLFAGLVTDPQFKNGTFSLVRVPYGGIGTLTISGAPISPVPLPSGFPLLVTALAGLGLTGLGRPRPRSSPPRSSGSAPL